MNPDAKSTTRKPFKSIFVFEGLRIYSALFDGSGGGSKTFELKNEFKTL
jgi:hypothetical protein